MLDWLTIDLGKRPDSAIAIELGLPKRTVCKVRNKLGIKAFGGLYLTQEGYTCRSILEVMVDAVFHWKNVQHVHQPKITCPAATYIADFWLPDAASND